MNSGVSARSWPSYQSKTSLFVSKFIQLEPRCGYRNALLFRFANLLTADAYIAIGNNIIENMKFLYPVLLLALLAASNALGQIGGPPAVAEKRLTNIKQLTFGGENAEAYFSSDGKQLIFQSK